MTTSNDALNEKTHTTEIEDLIQRMEKAIGRLDLLRIDTTSLTEKVRLEGKISGVRLALSYAQETLR